MKMARPLNRVNIIKGHSKVEGDKIKSDGNKASITVM